MNRASYQRTLTFSLFLQRGTLHYKRSVKSRFIILSETIQYLADIFLMRLGISFMIYMYIWFFSDLFTTSSIFFGERNINMLSIKVFLQKCGCILYNYMLHMHLIMAK